MSIVHPAQQDLVAEDLAVNAEAAAGTDLAYSGGNILAYSGGDSILAYNGGSNILASEEKVVAAEVAEEARAVENSPEYKHVDEEEIVPATKTKP